MNSTSTTHFPEYTMRLATVLIKNPKTKSDLRFIKPLSRTQYVWELGIKAVYDEPQVSNHGNCVRFPFCLSVSNRVSQYGFVLFLTNVRC